MRRSWEEGDWTQWELKGERFQYGTTVSNTDGQKGYEMNTETSSLEANDLWSMFYM